MDRQEKIQEVLNRGVENIFPNKDALEKVLNSDKKLKIYYGIDPTGPSLHLGHSVQLLKLRQLQDLGHRIVILIGDFTAMIGDPTDKAAVRKQLTKKEVLGNAKHYKRHVGKILNLRKTKFERNSKWHKKMDFSDLVHLTSNFTAQQTLARDMFKKRLEQGKDLFLHEFLYPIMQAYDSVAMDVDMEIGGNDQMFNMMAGRTLMKKLKNKEKFVLTTKLLVDPSGKKMGKSEGNMVNIDDVPEEMYGKVMSWPDNMIVIAFELLTTKPMVEIKQIVSGLAQDINPKEYKMQLALSIVEMYHGATAAKKAEENFRQVFQEKLNPDNIKALKTDKTGILDILVAAGFASSITTARALIKQGGVKVDGVKVEDENFQVKNIDADGVVVQKGKRHFIKIIK